MSFITKRERVFNEYDLFDLPPRNEGKLKAYASCTDARAWSHFGSDKTEHLVEIIKRNNDICRPKYLSTDVIVQTLMAAKNAEISRLKRKIEEFEQMLAAYDQLELTCEQKCEIANAHTAIRAANKELDELCLDLDLSGFTEGMDSDAFETGKSRGDEPDRWKGIEIATSRAGESIKSRGDDPYATEDKSNQTGLVCPCDAATSVEDSRIQEMQDTIISKDAKLNAMRNTIAVMENDVCEPYCIYAHIYTALEKIFGVLCQNDKYKLYLNLMTAGKDTRCIDIKGKILYKLKVLEKFGQALIAPCSQPLASTSNLECACLRAEVIARLDFPPTMGDLKEPTLDNKRAQLVADIMDNDDMKEILSKDSCSDKNDDDNLEEIDNYSIQTENLKRLKNLQENYDELMACYEKMKYEKDGLETRLRKCEELEKECENLKSQLREYNSLWNEKEHYRKRSMDIDSLKEQYMILADETSNLETQLKAESEINLMKNNTIEDLRNANLALEKKLNDALIAFEREKNTLQCKLKETECTVMCQDQQIKTLSAQIDRFIEQGHDKELSTEDPSKSLALIDEIESLKQQINNLKDTLFCSEEEKQQLLDQYQDKLRTINELRMEIEDWKNTFQREVQRLTQENKALSDDLEDKTMAVENLKNIVDHRSQEIESLIDQLEKNKNEKKLLSARYQDLRNLYDHSITSIENEKLRALQTLTLARRESQELLNKVNEYSNQVSKTGEPSTVAGTKVKDTPKSVSVEQPLYQDDNSILLNEIQKLREANSHAITSIDTLQEEKNEYRTSLELTKKKSEILETKLKEFERVSEEMESLKFAHDNLMKEKDKLEKDLLHKKAELEKALQSIQLSKKESNELIDHFNVLESELNKLNDAYDQLMSENDDLQRKLSEKSAEAENFLQSLNMQSEDLKQALQKITDLESKLSSLRADNEDLMNENNILQNHLDDKAKEIHGLNDTLKAKCNENKNLHDKIQTLESNQKIANDHILALRNENVVSQTTLEDIRRESTALIDKLKNFESLNTEFEKLTNENESMQEELDRLTAAIKKLRDDNNKLNDENQCLQTINKDIEQSLIDARNQLLAKPGSPRLSSEDILREIESLKKEKLQSENKIKNLINSLDESENIIATLNENLLARDDKIAMLENNINELEDEIRKLHDILGKVIETGEQISTNSSEKYELSLKNLEAHHSRAAHNIKMEMAELQNENVKLGKQLNTTKRKSEESSQDVNKYLSLVKNLENEREIIVTDIKQLEMFTVGDSLLSPQHCKLDDIINSLDRIRKNIQEKSSKSSSLELTIQKVQTSSQVLLNKADEAKKIVEKEKQKVIKEKEEAIREKLSMENKLSELKNKLENQIASDQEVIKDLQARIQNQQLIAQNSISKLENEIQNIQCQYQNSLSEIEELKENLWKLTEKYNKNLRDNEILNKSLLEKSEGIAKLQKELGDLKNKQTCDVALQGVKPIKINVSCQTDNYQHASYNRDLTTGEPDIPKDIVNGIPQAKILQSNKPTTVINPASNLLPEQAVNSVNEVQILTASVETTFDFERSSYLNYKMQQLGPGKLEQYSYSDEQSPQLISLENNENNLKPIDNNQSVYGTTLKATTKGNYQNKKSDTIPKPYDDNNTDIDRRKRKHATMNEPLKIRDDENLLVLYKEPEKKTNEDTFTTISKDKTHTKSPFNPEQGSSKDSKKQKHIEKQKPKQHARIESDQYSNKESVKTKLKIDLPRVNNESYNIITTSEGDRKSDDSDFINIYSSPKRSSLTDTKIHSEVGITIIKKESPSLPILLTVDDNKGSYSSFEMSSELEQSDRDQRDRNINLLRNQIMELKNRDKNLSDDDLELIRRRNNLRMTNNNISHHGLSRVEADPNLIKPNIELSSKQRPFAFDYILDSLRHETDPENVKIRESPRSRSDEGLYHSKAGKTYGSVPSNNDSEYKTSPSLSESKITQTKFVMERSVMAKGDDIKEYEEKIRFLTNSLEITERDFKKKLAAIKTQYDSNIKNIMNEHNQGVKNIQGLHEETLQDIIKIHENEIENLRSMSIEANRKAEKLEKENRSLKSKIDDTSTTGLDEEPVKISSDTKRRRKSRFDSKMLTKTNIVACNVKPKSKSNGPCTCSLDGNISDTIKNIFEQVNIEQRKIAEHTYIKYIANKILNGNVEALDAQELSFLHLKVCRTWKMKLSKEEALQKRIDNLESELISRQRHAQQHIVELDRRVEEEKRRLQEVREAVCRSTPGGSRAASPDSTELYVPTVPPVNPLVADFGCGCNAGVCGIELNERRSAGDLTHVRQKRARTVSNRAVSVKMDADDRKERRLYHDDPPTRLRRSHERPIPRVHKK